MATEPPKNEVIQKEIRKERFRLESKTTIYQKTLTHVQAAKQWEDSLMDKQSEMSNQ